MFLENILVLDPEQKQQITDLGTSVRSKFKVEKIVLGFTYRASAVKDTNKELMEETFKLQFLSPETPNHNLPEKAGFVMSLLGSLAEQSSSEALSEEYEIILFSIRHILNMFRGLTSICFESGGSICA